MLLWLRQKSFSGVCFRKDFKCLPRPDTVLFEEALLLVGGATQPVGFLFC